MREGRGGQGSELAAVLAAREERARRQAELLARSALPLVSLTLVSPGPEKSGPEFTAFMDLAEAALLRELASRGFRPLGSERREGAEGPELLLLVGGAEGGPEPCGAAVKEACLALEEGEAWGRLLDLDVIERDAEGGPRTLRRGELGLPPRPCLLCGESALECRYSLRHGSGELAARAAELRAAALLAADPHPSGGIPDSCIVGEAPGASSRAGGPILGLPEASGLVAGMA